MKQQSFLGQGIAIAGQPEAAMLVAHGWHRIAYAEWGNREAEHTVVCAHGLTRNGRDFDILAERLCGRARVICPDMPGRGRSEWLANPAQYSYPQYMLDVAALVARLDVPEVDWIGTSMGGLIGMMLAAQPNSPIRRLVINDVGALVPKESLERIGGYVGKDPTFDGPDDLEAYLRRIHEPFGDLTDAQWRHLARHAERQKPGGKLGLAYDPAIGLAFQGPMNDIDLWAVWERIRCPVMVLRGLDSDLLRHETAVEMTRRGPKAVLHEIPACGHAPSLMAEDQIALVADWLGL